MASDWMCWLPLVTILLSFVASAVLLLWLCKVKKVIAWQLMARQLWHLAVADLATSISHFFSFGLPPLWVSFGIANDEKYWDGFDTMCIIGMYGNVPFMVSVLIEVHIALASAAVVARRHRLMRGLSCTLPLAWPLGALLGLLIAGPKTDAMGWDEQLGRCNAFTTAGERSKAVMMLAALLASLASYVAGAVSTGQAAGSVQRRAWRRSIYFVAVAIITWLPYVILDFVYIWPDDDLITSENEHAFDVAFALLLSNGLMNAFVYALQSHVVRRTWSRAGRVGIGGSSSADERVVEFGVAFRSFTEVIEIAPSTAEANNRAACMTDALELQDGPLAAEAEDGGDLLACFDLGDGGARAGPSFQFADVFSMFFGGAAAAEHQSY